MTAKAATALTSRPEGKLTPMMSQYWDIKEQYPDALLLFRMGDFYETFHVDAQTASAVLGIALTTRDRDSANPTPLAGVPHHSIENYIARLLRAGYKVAVCEQLEDPTLAKGLVKRGVTEVLTPGTALTPTPCCVTPTSLPSNPNARARTSSPSAPACNACADI